MFKSILLQGKFILVEILNVTYNIIPNPLRNFYLRCFGIEIGSASSIHRCCKFFHVGKLVIGKNSVVNFGCYLDNRRGISIGNNVGVAHNPQFETKGAPVTIEDDVFIFSNVMIMPGVTIGQGAIVLPGSVVTKDVPSRKIVGGNPARIIRNRIAEIDYKQSYNYLFAL